MKNGLLLIGLLLATPLFGQQTVFKSFEVDSAAEPRGGMSYLTTFLQVNLRKPVPAESKSVSGRVILNGIVEPTGRVSGVTVAQSLRPDMDREAVRVFKLFNAWKPAVKEGKSVRQLVTIPITYKPNEPYIYRDGTRIDYYDKDSKLISDSGSTARYKRVIPLDSVGRPTGDVVIYERKRSDWNEWYRLPLLRKKHSRTGPTGQPLFLLGHQNADQQWQGTLFTVDADGTIFAQGEYDTGKPVGLSVEYHANGSVAEASQNEKDTHALSSWFPNGQIKKIWTTNAPGPLTLSSSDKVTALWDSTGRQLVKAGNGLAIYTGSVRSYVDTTQRTLFVEQGLYQDGLKQGTWKGSYADGSYFYQELYDKGICQGGKAIKAGRDTVRYMDPGQQPEFPGGLQGLGQFLSQNLRYPIDAQKAGVQGRVFVSFVVCTDGTLCDYEVLKSVSPSVDQEAVRVVKAMSGRWKPGYQRGEAVRVKYNLPINFSLY